MKHIFLKDTCTWVSIWMFKEQFSAHAFHVEYCHFKSVGSVYMFTYFFLLTEMTNSQKIYYIIHINKLSIHFNFSMQHTSFYFLIQVNLCQFLNVQRMWNIIHNTP